jgi:hypothetical protein
MEHAQGRSATTPPAPAAPAAGSDVDRLDALDALDALAARFLLLADADFAGYSPAYDRIARAMAADPASLALVAGLTPVNRTPVLALAAVHHLVLADPGSALAAHYRGEGSGDVWPPFRSLLHERADEVRSLMASRSIQTNEVGRAAALLPGLATVLGVRAAAGDGRPLALVEIGPSAGLNLVLDRFGVTYTGPDGAAAAVAGDPSSVVQLRCELRGGTVPPVPPAPLPIARREGLDLDPVDVTDDDACRWLAACLWPGAADRAARLAGAIAVAREDPPPLHRGDAVADLPGLLGPLPDDVVVVVVATWALGYLSKEGRLAVAAAVDELGRRRDIALLTAEAPQVTPWVPPVPASTLAATTDGDGSAGGAGTSTVVGLHDWHRGEVRSRPLGVMHPHGRWLAWCDEEGR